MTISVGFMFAVAIGVAAAPSFLAILILRVLLMLPSSVSCDKQLSDSEKVGNNIIYFVDDPHPGL